MRLILLGVTLLGVVGACDSKREAQPAETGGVDTGFCAVPPLEAGLMHRAEPVDCPAERAVLTPEPYDCNPTAKQEVGCNVHSDCVDGENGRCMRDAESGWCGCAYDGCSSDDDCSSGEFCICGETTNFEALPVNICVEEGDCRSDADCGEGGLCLGTLPRTCQDWGYLNPGIPNEFYCTTPDDECHNNESCWCEDKSARCVYSSAEQAEYHWMCTEDIYHDGGDCGGG